MTRLFKPLLLTCAAWLCSLLPASAQTWDGTTASSYAGGDGTVQHPYLIANGSQLARLASDMQADADFTTGKHFRLTADIVLNEGVYDNIVRSTRQDKEDLPQDTSLFRVTPCLGGYKSDADYTAFKGTFDGDGHTISGMMGELYCSQTYDALFRVAEGATIKNLGISDSYLLSNARLGALVGRMIDSRVINCHVERTFVEGGGSQSGLLIGQCLGTSQVLNCYAEGVVFGKNDMGGLIGRIGDSNEHSCLVDNCLSRVELRIKRRNHGAVSFALCAGATVSNVYYQLLGEATHDFWEDQVLGDTLNVTPLAADDLASPQLLDALNQRAETIEDACQWKAGDGQPVLDLAPSTISHPLAIEDAGSTLLQSPTFITLDGRRQLQSPRRHGLYLKQQTDSNGHRSVRKVVFF